MKITVVKMLLLLFPVLLFAESDDGNLDIVLNEWKKITKKDLMNDQTTVRLVVNVKTEGGYYAVFTTCPVEGYYSGAFQITSFNLDGTPRPIRFDHPFQYSFGRKIRIGQDKPEPAKFIQGKYSNHALLAHYPGKGAFDIPPLNNSVVKRVMSGNRLLLQGIFPDELVVVPAPDEKDMKKTIQDNCPNLYAQMFLDGES